MLTCIHLLEEQRAAFYLRGLFLRWFRVDQDGGGRMREELCPQLFLRNPTYFISGQGLARRHSKFFVRGFGGVVIPHLERDAICVDVAAAASTHKLTPFDVL